MPSTPLFLSKKGGFFESKHMLCILVVLIVVVLFLIYMSWGSSPSFNSMCGYEGLKGRGRERLVPSLADQYKPISPALQAMLGSKEGIQYAERVKKNEPFSRQFKVMRTSPSPKSVNTMAQGGQREKFSNEYTPPLVLRASKGSTPQSPFFGPINL